MNELLEILNEIDDTIDYETETGLIDDHLLDSFAIISLVSWRMPLTSPSMRRR